MRRLILIAFIFALCPTLALAYTIILEDGTELREQDVLSSANTTSIDYGPVSVQYGSAAINVVKLDTPLKKEEKSLLPLVSVAEAAGEAPSEIMDQYFNAFQTIKNAEHLSELKSVVDRTYYQHLKGKLDAGVNEIVLLEMVKNLMPEKMSIVDSREYDINESKVVARGWNHFGEMHGVATMVNEDGVWKLKEEMWMSNELAERQKLAPVTAVALGDEYDPLNKEKRFQLTSSEYYFDKNHLSLHDKHGYRIKNAFMLYFYIAKEDPAQRKGAERDDLGNLIKKPDLHIAFSGPRRILGEQKRYKEEFPLDVSIAKDKDGYMSDTWNLQLPKKKPKALVTGFMMNF